MRSSWFLLQAGLFLFVSSLNARVIHVPSEYGTIQGGISASSDFDTVLVDDGTYSEHIDFMGRRIVVKSENGPLATTIQSADSGQPIIRIVSGESESTILEGFTVQNSMNAPGVLITEGSPIIIGNIFRNNQNTEHGGAIRAIGGFPQIIGNIFQWNTTTELGGGAIFSLQGSIIISGNSFSFNTAPAHHGGAIHIFISNKSFVDHNLFYQNSCLALGGALLFSVCTNGYAYNNTVVENTDVEAHGAGVTVWYSSDCHVYNNIIVGNNGIGLYSYPPNNSTATYNDVWNNEVDYDGIEPGEGSISADPQFVNPPLSFELGPNSPCIDAGDPSSPPDPDGSRADMGAFNNVSLDYGVIAGWVTDTSWLPLQDVQVSILQTPISDLTNEEGYFCLGEVRVDRLYNIRFSHYAFYDTTLTDISVNINDTTFLNVVLRPLPPPGAISGFVTDTLMSPVNGVTVQVLSTEISSITDANGWYFLGPLPPQSYDISFTHYDYVDTTVAGVMVTSGDATNLDVVLKLSPPRGAIAGVITSRLLDPIGGATVLILPDGPSDISDNQGRFFIGELRPDDYDVSVSHPFYRDTLMEDFAVPSGDTAQLNVMLSESYDDYRIIFGNLDGSPIPALISSTVDIPVWGATPADSYDDSIGFMHIPLASNDAVVTARLSGAFPDSLVGRWDERSFLNPNPEYPMPGWTSHSMLGFHYLTDPRDPQNLFWTNGEALLICSFRMQIADDPSLVGDTLSVLMEGNHPQNGGLLWGDEDGVDAYVPVALYSNLYFLSSSDVGFIRGSVYDSLFSPIPNVRVNAIGTDRSSVTDISGLFFLGWLETETYDLQFRKEGLIDTIIQGVEVASSETTVVNLVIGQVGNQCIYVPGDINGNGSTNGLDVTYGVAFFKGGAEPPVSCNMCPVQQPFYGAGDVNGSCFFNGIDIIFLIGYFKGDQPTLLYCPDCPPGR